MTTALTVRVHQFCCSIMLNENDAKCAGPYRTICLGRVGMRMADSLGTIDVEGLHLGASVSGTLEVGMTDAASSCRDSRYACSASCRCRCGRAAGGCAGCGCAQLSSSGIEIAVPIRSSLARTAPLLFVEQACCRWDVVISNSST